jgi:spore maturation protein CgeB
VTFEGIGDLATCIRYYLSHRQERDVIAEAGHKRTCSEYAYSKITSQALSFALSLAPSSVVDREVARFGRNFRQKALP